MQVGVAEGLGKNIMRDTLYEKLLFVFFVFSLPLLLPLLASAQGLVPQNCQGVTNIAQCTLCDLLVLINRIYLWILGISALLGVGLITFAGVKIIINSANPGKAKEAQGLIINTLVALAIIFGSWLIANQVLVALTGAQKTDFFNFSCQSDSLRFAKGGEKGGGTLMVIKTRGTSDDGTGNAATTPTGGGSPTAASNEMNKLIEQRSITEYGATPNQACASGVSKALVNAGVLTRAEARAKVGDLGTLLYTQKGYTTIITNPSQLKPGDVVFVRGGDGGPAEPATWTTWGWGPVKNGRVGSVIQNKGEPGHVGMWTNKGFVNNRSSSGTIQSSTMYDFRFALRKQ